MKRLTREERVGVLAALVEGNSIRSTVRMTGISKPTVLKLLVDMGRVCGSYMDKTLRDLPCRHLQVDEIWSFVYAKEKHLPYAKSAAVGAGDVWTFVALDADTKLAVSWMVGERDLSGATMFMEDVASRLKNRVQLTTDGLRVYLDAVDIVFGTNIDFAQLRKVYGSDRSGEARYSPARYIASKRVAVQGLPDMDEVSTSYVERQNLTMRMSMRRFTRLTNGFSKKLENHVAAISLHFMHYNFCREHQTLKKITPAMAAGVSDHIWELDEIVALLEAIEPNAVEVAKRASEQT
jgi:IS1 family transposase